MNGNERIEAKRNFVFKKHPIFSLNPIHCPFWKNFEQKCTKTLAEVDNILQKAARVDSLLQTSTVINRMPW